MYVTHNLNMMREVVQRILIAVQLFLDANENAREILSCICKKQGLTEGKRFSYLNAFVKLVTKSDVWAGGLGYSVEELQYW